MENFARHLIFDRPRAQNPHTSTRATMTPPTTITAAEDHVPPPPPTNLTHQTTRRHMQIHVVHSFFIWLQGSADIGPAPLLRHRGMSGQFHFSGRKGAQDSTHRNCSSLPTTIEASD